MAESLGALLETCLEAEESTQNITVDHTPISNERARGTNVAPNSALGNTTHDV